MKNDIDFKTMAQEAQVLAEKAERSNLDESTKGLIKAITDLVIHTAGKAPTREEE